MQMLGIFVVIVPRFTSELHSMTKKKSVSQLGNEFVSIWAIVYKIKANIISEQIKKKVNAIENIFELV